MVTEAQIREQMDLDRKAQQAAFDDWQAKPEVKLMVSLLPPLAEGVQRDCFDTLLRICFAAGIEQGTDLIMRDLLRGLRGGEKR